MTLHGFQLQTHPVWRWLAVALLALLAALLWWTPGAGADVVAFRSGRIKEVIVVEETDQFVTVESADGVLRLPRTAVVSITRASRAENAALRSGWLAAARARARAPEQARRAWRARARLGSVRNSGAGVGDGERVTQARADQVAAAQANAAEAERRRIDAFRRSRAQQDPATATREPLIVQGLTVTPGDDGLIVTGSLMNVSRESYGRIELEVQLVEHAGTRQEQVAYRDVVWISELPVDRVYEFRVELPGRAEDGYDARAILTDGAPLAPAE